MNFPFAFLGQFYVEKYLVPQNLRKVGPSYFRVGELLSFTCLQGQIIEW